MGITESKQSKPEYSREKRKDGIVICVTGLSGVGKTSFINAFRGLYDDDCDNGAASIDVKATLEPTKNKHPLYPMISFVDLPGVGTQKFPDLHTYCREMRLEDYDKFLIFTAGRLTTIDVMIATKVKSLGKPFFLIRTKIDDDCLLESRKLSFNEEEMLKSIRKNYCENLMISEDKIFLISNYEKEIWDFKRLVTAISEETQS